MKITSFRGKTAMLSTEIMEKNEQLGNDRPRQGTVPCPSIKYSFRSSVVCRGSSSSGKHYCGGVTFMKKIAFIKLFLLFVGLLLIGLSEFMASMQKMRNLYLLLFYFYLSIKVFSIALKALKRKPEAEDSLENDIGAQGTELHADSKKCDDSVSRIDTNRTGDGSVSSIDPNA